MAERKNVYVLDSTNIGKAAAQTAQIIQRYSVDDPCPGDVISEETHFTAGQVSRIIKYMRRCSERDLEKYIRWYPISSKKGYFFPKKWDDFLPCFATLYKWHKSVERTIAPMAEKMDKVGVDYRQYLKDVSEELEGNYLEDIEEMNKHTSWFLDED